MAEFSKTEQELFDRIEDYILFSEDSDATQKALREIICYFPLIRDNDDAQILYPRNDDILEVVFSTKNDNIGFSVPVEDSVCGAAYRNNEVVVVSDVRRSDLYKSFFGDGIRSEIAVPARMYERVIGIVNIESTKIAAFDEHYASSMERFADQVATLLMLIRFKNAAIEETELRAANDILDTLGADAGFLVHKLHNIVTPIMILAGQMKRLYSAEMTDELQECLRDIGDIGNEARVLREEIRKRVLDYDTIDVNATINDVIGNIQLPSDCEVFLNLAADLPSVRCSSFRQVFKNLIQNATNAMSRKGGICRLEIVTQKIAYRKVHKGYVEILVHDTGEGLDEQARQQAFRRGTSGQHGFGVGLWWTKLVLVKSGGQIEIRPKARIENHGSEGTLVRVRLPFYDTNRSYELNQY